jgi:hypothetical protein
MKTMLEPRMATVSTRKRFVEDGLAESARITASSHGGFAMFPMTGIPHLRTQALLNSRRGVNQLGEVALTAEPKALASSFFASLSSSWLIV